MDEFARSRSRCLLGENIICEYYVRISTVSWSIDDSEANVRMTMPLNYSTKDSKNKAANANAGQGKPVRVCVTVMGWTYCKETVLKARKRRTIALYYVQDAKMLLMQAPRGMRSGSKMCRAMKMRNNMARPGGCNVMLLIQKNAIDHSVTNQDEHEIHNEVQQLNVIDSTSVDMGNSNGNTFDADVDNQPVQDLALNEDNIFQTNESGSANPQAGLSNASILSEVHTLENVVDHSVTNQDEHEIHNEVQQSNVIDSTSVYMGNSNVIPYEQYLSVNNIFVVPSCASSTLNNVCVSSANDAFVPHDPIANELKIYKEQVSIYEQRAKFKLTEREQRMDDQMRMLI
ncbi:hypothetical protein Tco_0430900 [Tanacetum coccineum]